MESCIAVAIKDSEAVGEVDDVRRESGNEGCRRTALTGGYKLFVELGRRVVAEKAGEVGDVGDPLRLDAELDLALKAFKNDRGEGGEVDIDCCSLGKFGAAVGDPRANAFAEVDDAGRLVDCRLFASSGFSAAAFFRSSSSRF
jgi:hypothetical protein